MYLKQKRLVNSYEERMLEFLETCIDSNSKIYTQVSLSQICEPITFLDPDLRKFLFSSSIDALVTDLDFMPCLAIEFQSSYHDSANASERDQKKARLLSMAKVPLIYSRIKDFGLLQIYSQDEVVIFNLFTGQGREAAKVLIQKYCYNSNSQKLKIVA
jgi:hypothetical protein